MVDASVAVEVLLRTSLGQRAWALIQSDELLAPDLLDAEVLAVLRRETLAGRLAERRARQAIDDLMLWAIDRIPSVRLLPEAWSLRANVSAYDALYLAVAVQRDAAVLTADGALKRAPVRGIAIHNLRA